MGVRKTLCRLADVPENGAIAVDLPAGDDPSSRYGGGTLIVVRRAGQIRAYRNICPHAGRGLDWAPGQFIFEDAHLICAAHGAMFSFFSGECVSGPCRGSSLAAIAIEVVDDAVVLAAAA